MRSNELRSFWEEGDRPPKQLKYIHQHQRDRGAFPAMPTTFDGVLDAIETLSTPEQEALVALIQKRLIDRRRAEIAANIRQARAEYQAGEIFQGSVEEAIAELDQ